MGATRSTATLLAGHGTGTNTNARYHVLVGHDQQHRRNLVGTFLHTRSSLNDTTADLAVVGAAYGLGVGQHLLRET